MKKTDYLKLIGTVALLFVISGVSFYVLQYLVFGVTFIRNNTTGLDNTEYSVVLPVDHTSGLWGERIMNINTFDGEKDEELEELLAYWRDINPYVCAIIRIHELAVVDPVIQSKISNKQWLRTDIYGEPNICGSVFMDYRCDLKSNAVKMIHGHNMSDGTVFGRLPDYLFANDISEVPTVELYSDAGLVTYKAYAIMSVDSTEEALPLDNLTRYDDVVATTEEFLQRSWVPGGKVTSLDTLVLNTCWYGKTNKERNLHCLVILSKV